MENDIMKRERGEIWRSASKKYSNALCLLHIIWFANEL